MPEPCANQWMVDALAPFAHDTNEETALAERRAQMAPDELEASYEEEAEDD